MTKKIVLAILSHGDVVDPVSRALVEKHFPVTHISSMGGFLRRGGATLMVGVDESQVQNVLAVIRETCAGHSKPDAHAATVFVLNATDYIQV